MSEPKKVALYTLGCKVNQYESEALLEMFRRRGYEPVDFSGMADVYVINTCTVTHLGDRKSRQMIRRAAKTNPAALIVVTGCYAQTSPGEVLGIPGVDLVVGTTDRERLMELVEHHEKGETPVNAVGNIMATRDFEELPVSEMAGHTRAFLKIQEGCDNYCSYCIVPYARGPLRSRPPERVLEEAERMLAKGYREIVLTGIHTGAYGRDLSKSGSPASLAALIRELGRLKGLKRLRLSSIEPFDITLELIDVLAETGVLCRHLHIPLQSGDDEILQKMNRKYTVSDFSRLIGTIRNRIPGVAITTDVIVGFPGETARHFENTRHTCSKISFSGMHVFKYSPRQGTPAASLPGQVPPPEKEERSKILRRLAAETAQKYAANFLGQETEILVEQEAEGYPGYMEGLTDNYLRVVVPGGPDLKGSFIGVRLAKLSKGNLVIGELTEN